MADLVDAMVQETHLGSPLIRAGKTKPSPPSTSAAAPRPSCPRLARSLGVRVLRRWARPSRFPRSHPGGQPGGHDQSPNQAWLGLGVTRLSLGVQSFHDETLAWMNRAHTGVQAERAIRLAHDLGVRAMTLDLIYGVPTSRNWSDDIDRATALPIQHLSAYALTVEPGTVLGTRVERGAEHPAPDARIAGEYHRLCDAMAAQGWSHYETSNWAAPKPGQGHHTSQHNSAYWSGAPYLALGPGAHGFWLHAGTPTCPTTPGTSKPSSKEPCWTSGRALTAGTGTTSW